MIEAKNSGVVDDDAGLVKLMASIAISFSELIASRPISPVLS